MATRRSTAGSTERATERTHDGGDDRLRARARGRGKYDRSLAADERTREKRQILYQAATRVFASRGYTKSTVDDVCDAAGVSRRTFYEHFRDLEDLFMRLHDRLGRMAFAAVEAFVTAHEDPDDQTRAGVEGLLGLVARFPAESRVVFRELWGIGPEAFRLRYALLARFAALMTRGLSAAHAAGRYRKPPDEIRVYALVSAIEAVGMKYMDSGEHERALEAAPALVDMIIAAFR